MIDRVKIVKNVKPRSAFASGVIDNGKWQKNKENLNFCRNVNSLFVVAAKSFKG